MEQRVASNDYVIVVAFLKYLPKVIITKPVVLWIVTISIFWQVLIIQKHLLWSCAKTMLLRSNKMIFKILIHLYTWIQVILSTFARRRIPNLNNCIHH